MSRSTLLGLVACVLAGLSGCASPARIVSQDVNRVVIAIPEKTNYWPTYYEDEARKLASTMLNDPVVAGGSEVKVGETVLNNQQVNGQMSSSATTVQNKTEFHMIFEPKIPVEKVSTSETPPIPGVLPNGGTPIRPVGGQVPVNRQPDLNSRTTVPPVTLPGNSPRGNFPTTGQNP